MTGNGNAAEVATTGTTPGNLRAVVLGAGRMGIRHVAALRRAGHEVAGICDAIPEALEVAARETGIPRSLGFTDAAALLDEVKPDIAVIATTATSHRDLTCLAADRGVRYILCEKPMACSLQECDDMLHAAETNQSRLAVNHVTRYFERFRKIQEIVAAEDFGGIESVTVVAGNIGLCMNGVHQFDFFRHLAGEPAQTVAGWMRPIRTPNPRGRHFEDMSGSVRATTAGGKCFYITAEEGQGHGATMIVAGPYGQLIAGTVRGDIRVDVRLPEHRKAAATQAFCPSDQRVFTVPDVDVVEGAATVINALITGEGWPTGVEGRHAIEVLVGAYVSSEQGGAPVRTDDLPTDRMFPWA